MKRLLILFFFISSNLFGQNKATWIWYPTDFEIWLGNQMQNRRVERNAFVPPFWRVYSHHPLVNFTKKVDLAQPEEIRILSEGRYNVTIDGRYVQTDISKVMIPAGTHTINLQVVNEITPPSVFVEGTTIASDSSWNVKVIRNNNDDNFPSADAPVFADSWNFNAADTPPSKYKLPTKVVLPTQQPEDGKGLVDFGTETFGFIKLRNLSGKGVLHFYYGESMEEALSVDSCETLDHFVIDQSIPKDFVTTSSRALRFVNIVPEGNLKYEAIELLYEYLPVQHRGAFESSDPLINQIWSVSEYTLELTTREFFIDGIKRDRWIWSGDANQSYLMNYYTFFDNDVVKRTIRQLRGAEPVEAHINTIVDYSLYWFMSIYDYYLYTGDDSLLRQLYPKMITLMDFVLARRNSNGFLEALPGDWLFLDWAPISKDGELSAIQMLLSRGLETMALTAGVVGDQEKAKFYSEIAADVRHKIMDVFWDKDKNVFIHSRKGGEIDGVVTRYANMFAMMFGYLDEAQIESVKNNVMLNDSVLKITTPYMRFYELEALCNIGQQDYVTRELRNYWGGMLREGATSFWELYNPAEHGVKKYAMYSRPFGKSLCHAWGASPLYLIGKYYLGVRPLKPGYAEYIIEPSLGGLKSIEGKVPTPHGDIFVKADERSMEIHPVKGSGIVRLKSRNAPKVTSGKLRLVKDNLYEVELDGATPCQIKYSPLKKS